MQTYDVISPNASKNSITDPDYRGGWPTCIDAFITAYPKHAYVKNISRSFRRKVLGTLKQYIEYAAEADKFSQIAETFFAVDSDQESTQDQAKKRRLGPNVTKSSAVDYSLDFPERLLKYIKENKEKYATGNSNKIPMPIPGETEWIGGCLDRIHDRTGIESREELILLLLEEYPALSHLKGMSASLFDSRYKSVKELIMLHQRQHRAVELAKPPSTGNSNKSTTTNDSAYEFPDRLFKFIGDNKERYTAVKIPRPILGENEWIRCCLVDIRCTTETDSWKKLIELFVKEYPRLSHLLKMDIGVFQTRYGAFKNLHRGSLNASQIRMLDHQRSQRRVSTQHESQSSHPGSGADSISLQDPSPDVCHDIESEQTDLATPQISMNLEDLSPDARDDIKSALYGQADTSVDVAVQPARSVARRSPRFKTLGFESGLDFQDSDIQVGGAPDLFDNSPVPSPNIPARFIILSLSLRGLLPVTLGLLCLRALYYPVLGQEGHLVL